MGEYGKIFWHDAHHEALQLELQKYASILEFEYEPQLNKEALRMDTLIIKKKKNVKIEKNIGKIFKGHNIVEYKSETDKFSYWDYHKLLSYAYTYISNRKVPPKDLTLTISLTIFPRKLITRLEEERGITLQEIENGIYYITGEALPIQILESKKLAAKENRFLRHLRRNVKAEDMQKVMFNDDGQPLIDKSTYLNRLIQANPTAFEEAVNMFTEEVKDIFMNAIEKNGWLENYEFKKVNEMALEIAKNFLLLGIPPDKVVKATNLSLDVVLNLTNDPIPAGV